jgi:hypothetical protein
MQKNPLSSTIPLSPIQLARFRAMFEQQARLRFLFEPFSA